MNAAFRPTRLHLVAAILLLGWLFGLGAVLAHACPTHAGHHPDITVERPLAGPDHEEGTEHSPHCHALCLGAQANAAKEQEPAVPNPLSERGVALLLWTSALTHRTDAALGRRATESRLPRAPLYIRFLHLVL